MMATTHALVGVLIGAGALLVAPDTAPVALAAGLVGGAFPDLDLPRNHRRALHYPVYYATGGAAAAAVAVVAPTAATVGLAVFLLAAAAHSAMDALGGGLEQRPWERTSDEAVYSHFHGRWLRARRLVRYDGAPEDAALAAALAIPATELYADAALAVPTTGLYADAAPLFAGLVAVSAAYAVVRRPLIRFGEWLIPRAPDALVAVAPRDMVEDYV